MFEFRKKMSEPARMMVGLMVAFSTIAVTTSIACFSFGEYQVGVAFLAIAAFGVVLIGVFFAFASFMMWWMED